MKRILFYLSRFPAYGGIETVTKLIGLKLIECGYEISLVAHMQQNRDSELKNKTKFYLMPDGLKNSRQNRLFAEHIIEKDNIDAIVYQDSYAPTEKIVCCLADKYAIPLFVFEHNTPLCRKKVRNISQSGYLRGLYRRLISYPLEDFHFAKRKIRLLDACSKYVLLSTAFLPEMDEILRGHHYDKEKVTSINNPILFCPISSENLQKKDKIILTICQLSTVKRVDVMLQIWKALSLPDWKFIIVGDGPAKMALQKMAYNQNIKNVEFTGFTDPASYYERAKLFWMTSSFEGWPMTLLESMQKGCIPIAFDSFSSAHDIIDDNKNGFIVPQNDIESFQEKTLELVNSPDMQTRMSVDAIYMASLFNLSKIVEYWILLLS